jgi:hypothetical protein
MKLFIVNYYGFLKNSFRCAILKDEFPTKEDLLNIENEDVNSFVKDHFDKMKLFNINKFNDSKKLSYYYPNSIGVEINNEVLYIKEQSFTGNGSKVFCLDKNSKEEFILSDNIPEINGFVNWFKDPFTISKNCNLFNGKTNGIDFIYEVNIL